MNHRRFQSIDNIVSTGTDKEIFWPFDFAGTNSDKQFDKRAVGQFPAILLSLPLRPQSSGQNTPDSAFSTELI